MGRGQLWMGKKIQAPNKTKVENVNIEYSFWECEVGVTGRKMNMIKILTLAAAASESEPCPTFLMPSVPNWARTLCGASLRATAESAGPRSLLQIDMASSPISSMATTGPEDTNCTRLLQNAAFD